MSEFKLGNWETRPYGLRAKGVVTFGNLTVPICVRKPEYHVPQSGTAYVLAPGWTNPHTAMRFSAIAAVNHGHTAVSLNHTNKGASAALQKNADDIAAVLDAMPNDMELAVIGHSMGGATAIMALGQTDRQVQRATVVAPARHLLEHYYTTGNIARQIWEARREPRSLEGDIQTARVLGSTTLRHILQRPLAVGAEFFALMRGSVHDELRALKAYPDAPYLRIAYGDTDGLFPAFAMEDSIKDLPYDDRIRYEGGHCRVNYDPALAETLLTLDDTKTRLSVGSLEVASRF